jgi:hypothetical protein
VLIYETNNKNKIVVGWNYYIHIMDMVGVDKMKKNTKEVKCYSCGSMTSDPYVYHIVPSSPMYDIKSIPIYSKNGPKIRRVDLEGKRKIAIYNYCSNECYENTKVSVD